ncbi:MAG TPA: alpha-mannosidase, partial [Clostridiales bacterium]|nr:alpha-mannosidase [Clostridiales bacterium]
MPKLRDYDHDRVLRYYKDIVDRSMYRKIKDLEVICYWSEEPLSWKDRQSGRKMNLSVGDAWGTWYECAWFHFTADLTSLPKDEPLAVLIDIEGELLITDSHENPVRGLTSVGCRTPKTEYILNEIFIKENWLDMWADAGSNDLFRKPDKRAHLRKADLVVVNPIAQKLHYHNGIISGLLEVLPTDSARYAQLKNVYLDCAHMVTDQGPEAFEEAIRLLETQLVMKNGDYPLKITAIGHGHLDLAWLWPKREAVRKAARTLTSAIYLTEKYPGYVFGVSQPQMLQWMKEIYPDLYQRIQEAVKQGRIEPQGAMWVEADTNLPSGESLIRQIHYGLKYIKDEFGIDADYLWLPDVFGYSAALPQILKKSGVNTFFTQ